MQVVHWLPRTELPFAAPSSPLLLEWREPLAMPTDAQPSLASPVAASPSPTATTPVPNAVAAAPAQRPVERPKVEIPRPAASARAVGKPAVESETPVATARPVAVPPPRFALQLLRSEPCLLLIELPTGEPFQSRDPAYLLLKDMLRAAGLPDSPQIVGEPVRWPLLARGNLDQGPDAARDFVQGVVAVQMEQQPCVCLWLVGLPAVRFAGEANAESFDRELQVEGLGSAWALPGLELLMEEPARKASVWQAMRRLMVRWKNRDE